VPLAEVFEELRFSRVPADRPGACHRPGRKKNLQRRYGGIGGIPSLDQVQTMRTAEGGFNVSLTRDAGAGRQGAGVATLQNNQTGETAKLLRVPATSLQLGFANRQAEILNAPQWLIA